MHQREVDFPSHCSTKPGCPRWRYLSADDDPPCRDGSPSPPTSTGHVVCIFAGGIRTCGGSLCSRRPPALRRGEASRWGTCRLRAWMLARRHDAQLEVLAIFPMEQALQEWIVCSVLRSAGGIGYPCQQSTKCSIIIKHVRAGPRGDVCEDHKPIPRFCRPFLSLWLSLVAFSAMGG